MCVTFTFQQSLQRFFDSLNMPFSLQSAKYIDQRTYDLVSGYSRDIHSSFPYQDKSFYIIPQLIQMVILIFYHGEYFSIAGNFIVIHKPCAQIGAMYRHDLNICDEPIQKVSHFMHYIVNTQC